MEAMEVWRWINVITSFMAVPTLFWVKIRRYFTSIPLDQQYMVLSILMYPLCYSVATFLAIMADLKPGIWTGIMSAPIIWIWLAIFVAHRRNVREKIQNESHSRSKQGL